MTIRSPLKNELEDHSFAQGTVRHLNQSELKTALPENEMMPRHAYDLICEQMMIDGNSRLDLSSFSTTHMDKEVRHLMAETFDKNMLDKDESPQTTELENRCVSMLATLWHSPSLEKTIGCSTTGASEAAMLAGLAMKWQWQKYKKDQQLSFDKPNLVIGVHVQKCWEKFCRYWDIEMRCAKMTKKAHTLTGEKLTNLCDENTIGVVGILGSTYTGVYEPIEEIHDVLDTLNKKNNWRIPLHVDAACGGFIAPFLQPKLRWDLQLKWVKSINASGHKYGLVSPAIGWVIWKNKEEVPEKMMFSVNELGSNTPTFSVNFSRPQEQVIAQYYNFLRWGKKGYYRIHKNAQDIAVFLAKHIKQMGPFVLLSEGQELPVLAWKMKEGERFSVYVFSERMRQLGWHIPAYTLVDELAEVAICRIVVKENFSPELAELLLRDMNDVCAFFKRKETPVSL